MKNYYGLYRPSSVCPADKRRDVMSRWSSIWWANLSFGTFVAFNGLPFRSCTFVDLSYLWLSNQRYIICIQIFSENCWLNIFHLLFKLPLEIRFYHGAISDHGLSIFKHADLFYKRNGKSCFDVAMLSSAMSLSWWMALLAEVWKTALNVLSTVSSHGHIRIADAIYTRFWYFVLIVRVSCLPLGVKTLDEKPCAIFGNLYFHCLENLTLSMVFIFDNILCAYFLFHWNNRDTLRWENMHCICHFPNTASKKQSARTVLVVWSTF